MWSSLGRLWLYQNKNNIDDWTGFHPNIHSGLDTADKSAKLLHKIYYSSFQNSYIELKHWLLQIISLASFFKLKNQPYIFIKGFDNLVTDFFKIEYNNGFLNCTDEILDIVDLKNRDDKFVLNKINSIKNLLIENQKSNWVNLYNTSYVDLMEDLADDLSHPGPISNKKIFHEIIQYIDSQQLL
jgi:hypothetical protein